MVAKRQATRQQGRAVKKVKHDPVTAKVKEVLDAFQRDDCDVGGSPSFREGLVAAFPMAMGLGAAKDERHEYQEKVGNMVAEFLAATKDKFEESHKAAKDEHTAAEKVKSSKEADVTAAEAALEEHQKMESEARDTHVRSSDGVIEARKKLEATTYEVENFDAAQMAKAKERAEFGSALETEFASLKNGTVEDTKEKKSLLSTVNAVLDRLGVDKALISAAAPALTKAPAGRGGFDNTVVEQVEAALKGKVDSLAEDLNNGETTKASKMAAQASAQEELNAAEAKMSENQTTVSEAEAQTKQSKAALKQAKDSLKEQEKIVADLDIKAFYQKVHCENFSDAIAAFEFLRDRESTVPEAEAEQEVKEVAMEDETNTIGIAA